MKTLVLLLLSAMLLPAQENEDRVVLVPWSKAPKEVPLFFSATAEANVHVGLEQVTSEQKIRFHVHQGKAETVTLALTGPGEITEVIGDLRDWSIRVGENGARFLDIRPAAHDDKYLPDFEILVKTMVKVVGENAGLLLPAPGNAAGFALTINLDSDHKTEMKISGADGLVPVEGSKNRRFVGAGIATMTMKITPAGADARGIELLDAALAAKVAQDGASVSFRLTGTVRAEAQGSATELLGGGAALTSGVSGNGWHVSLRKKGESWVYDLIADQGGTFPMDLTYEVPVQRSGDWHAISFALPAGVVVPLVIDGFSKGVGFDAARTVVPSFNGNQWRGFLPASGNAELAWHEAAEVVDGSLFFSSTETTDVRVGSGLLRQLTVMDLRVLQGKLSELLFSIDGPGEILSVNGAQVLGWNVRENQDKRSIEVKLSRPIEGSSRIVIESQSALGGFPVSARALRMLPQGALRHSGWLRVANDGAVRIEMANASGLIQLAPGQFPGGVDEKLRQVSVYRFPTSEYDYLVNANQILPEVGLTEVSVYETTETDRHITSDLELDIREAPLREWEMELPADYAVAAVTGPEVADYVVAATAKEGRRVLKVLFKEAILNRQLVSLRLEKNEAAKAGAWELQPLVFPGVKTHRGYIGAVATAGYRLTDGKTRGVAEVPVTFFPKKTSGLQQAFRLREDPWSVALNVEALGQSVQADVFHLYSLKTGAVYGSVLINYFVVGAPATEWRISVPDGIGNVDVTGQNVGRDWRREGNTVIIPLSRPVLGAGTVLLTFEQAMNPHGGSLALGEVVPLGVQAERGYVQVVSPSQVNQKNTSSGALMKIEASELPTEFRLLSSSPSLGVWQYTARNFNIAMEIEWFKPGETADQVVDFQKLSSRISRDGQWVTDGRFFVKSRGRSALRMVFPKDAMLWEVKVDGESVNARANADETLVPLPARSDPNHAVEVAIRYGARASQATAPVLTAPKLDAPMVVGEWTISGDEGRQLVPRGGTADLVRPVLAENGWEWISTHKHAVEVLCVMGVIAYLLCRGSQSSLRIWLAVLCGAAFLALCIGLGVMPATAARKASPILEYAAPVVAAGDVVSVELGNVPSWQARTSVGMWLGFALGAAFFCASIIKQNRWWMACSLALIACALLSIRGGTVWFFCGVLLLGAVWWVPTLRVACRGIRKSKAAALAGMIAFLTAVQSWHAQAAEISSEKTAESMVHDWSIHNGRLHGTVEVTLRAEVGDRFLLLRDPAVLSSFEGAGLHVVKAHPGELNEYWLVADNAGKLNGKAVFEMPLADPAKGWALPSGPAAMRRVSVRWDQGGWEFICAGAAGISALPDLAAGQSGAAMWLGPVDSVTFSARPKQRNVAAEETKFFAEVSNLFIPGPGVVNGRHLLAVRPSQGKVSTVTLGIPDGFTVSDVIDGPVGNWRFDPEKRELRVSLEPAQENAFAFTIETQRGTETLPVDLSLEPLRVPGAAGEIGFLGIAFGEEVQSEGLTVSGLSRINTEDFNSTLIPQNKGGQPTVLLQHAFRYGTGEANAKIKVTAVAPELRAESWQLVSLGDDRLVVATDIAVTISRSGVFNLALDVPDGLEIESITGEGLSHWTEARADGKRTITLHLTGKTIGRREFSITLSGRPTAAQAMWQVPRLSLRDASRETGLLTIVPERGLQVVSINRHNVSPVDPRELAGESKETSRAAARPGALAYRILQGDWSLGLSISLLDPWVTARVFHDATIREGQLLSHVHIGYKIENAAVKSQRIRIPGLDATSAATMRATGPAVADFVPVEGEKDLWEIRFQRGIAGETDVDLEYQSPGVDSGEVKVQTIILDHIRQTSYYTAIRAGGRLELEAQALPRGWQRTDWAVVQSSLGHTAGNIAPNMSFSVALPESPLTVTVKRHELAKNRRLRVSEGALTTLLSPSGESLTAVEMKMLVVVKGPLRLTLPDGAKLFNVFVNDEGAALVREGKDWLFLVSPSPDANQATVVRFVYSSTMTSGRHLQGPVLDLPMENLTWRVIVPEGWRVAKQGGDFDLQEQYRYGSFRLEDYKSSSQLKRASAERSAVALLDQANAWCKAGDQEKAVLALGNLVNNGSLDEASGEDARVQLRATKTQQAVLGLNTRRQKIVLDNRLSTPQQTDNAQLNRAAEVNPVLRGSYNYDPKQFDRFLEGNTADENAALKEIANRIVSQQLAAEHAPAALEITLPERGTVLGFSRSVQVDSQRPMMIDLELKRANSGFAWIAAALCLLSGALAVLKMKK